MMDVDRFLPQDIDPFLALAGEEGWLCDRWEFEFLQQSFPRGSFVVRRDDVAVAFVTSVRHTGSGWVGNLLVRQDLRGQGIGRILLQHVLDTLNREGVVTVWLTASAEGKPLYEKLGFGAIDGIQRWRGTARVMAGQVADTGDGAPINEVDLAGWGDCRRLLLSALQQRSGLVANRYGFLMLQQPTDGMQLGPWGSFSARTAANLLDRALATLPAGTRLFLDVPERNRTAGRLLAERGFRPTGETVLMYRGTPPAYQPKHVFSLASMGSMG